MRRRLRRNRRRRAEEEEEEEEDLLLSKEITKHEKGYKIQTIKDLTKRANGIITSSTTGRME